MSNDDVITVQWLVMMTSFITVLWLVLMTLVITVQYTAIVISLSSSTKRDAIGGHALFLIVTSLPRSSKRDAFVCTFLYAHDDVILVQC